MKQRRLPLDLIVFALLAAGAGLAYWRHPGSSPARAPAAPAAEEGAAPSADAELRFQLEMDPGGGSRLNREGVDLARAGRYADAAAKLRAALLESPGNELAARNLRNVLTAWGFEELERGQPRAAADRFVEALGYGRTPQLLTGLGLANVRLRQYGDAVAVLEESLARGSSDGPTYLALGEAYEATDERVRALEMFQRAREAGVRSAALEDRIGKLGREVDAEWDYGEETSRHFRVRFDSGEDPHAAREVLRSLEAAYDVVGRRFGYYPERATPVVLYPDQDFHRVTQAPDWAAGVFDGRLKFPVRGLTAGPDLDRAVRHEYAHALISQLAGSGVPAWLNEGLAMWVEEEVPGERRAWAEEVAGQAEWLPLADLARPFALLPQDAATLAYAQSYLVVTHLVERYDERRIPRLLEALRGGRSIEAAFYDVYPIRFERFEEEAARAG